MASKRKPFDDARRRVNEKLTAIEEQREFIQNSVNQLITGVKKTAHNLLGETNKTKFFNKYRGVSQELEKCLDDLLLISATISSLHDDEEEESEEDDEEDKDHGASGHIEDTSTESRHKKVVPVEKKPLFVKVDTEVLTVEEKSSDVPELNADVSQETESNIAQLEATVTKVADSVKTKSEESLGCVNEPCRTNDEPHKTNNSSVTDYSLAKSSLSESLKDFSSKSEPPGVEPCENEPQIIDLENVEAIGTGHTTNSHVQAASDSLKGQLERIKLSKCESPATDQSQNEKNEVTELQNGNDSATKSPDEFESQVIDSSKPECPTANSSKSEMIVVPEVVEEHCELDSNVTSESLKVSSIKEEKANAVSVGDEKKPSSPVQLKHESSPVLVKQSPPGLVKQSPPVLVKQSPPGLVKQSSPVLVKQSLPGLVKQSPPVLVKQSSPVLVKQSSPVLVKQSLPGLVKQSSPVLVKQSPPGLVKQSSPALVKQSSPALVKQSSPALVKQSSPVLVKQSSPVLVKQSSPVLVKQSSPVLVKQSSPVLVKQSSPALVKQSSPVLVKQSSPVQLKASSPDHIEVFAGDVIEEILKEKSSETTLNSAKKKGTQIPSFKFPENKCCEVAVTEIGSPCEFWIQQTNGDLDLLMEELCIFFSKRAKAGDKGGMGDLPIVGEVCCGKFTEDDVWYRALVTAVSRENALVDVLYVDEGNKESLPLSRLRPLDEKFWKLPCQALCCELSGVQFSTQANVEQVNDWFKRRVSGETLEAVLADKDADKDTAAGSRVPIHLYIRPHGTASITNVNSLKLEYNILEMMIREGFSERVASPKNLSESSSASPISSRSDAQSLTKPESLQSSSTTTSGFHDAPSGSPSPAQSTDQRRRDHDTDPRTKSQGGEDCVSTYRVPPPVIRVDSDGSLYMLVSHVVSPAEFYVHFITTEAGRLDTLMDDMNRTYEESDHTNTFCPRVGDFCCAKFTGDGSWYRAMVLQVRYLLNEDTDGAEDSGEKKSTIRVFYIDFGNTENVNVENFRELLPRFMELPAQVVRCSLADVEPLTNWSDIPNEVFADTSADHETSSRVNNRANNVSAQRPNRKSPHKQRPVSRLRNRSRSSLHDNAIPIAAGDEDLEDDPLNTFFLLKEPRRGKTRSRSSISEDIVKRHRTPSSLSDTAVELFEKVWSGVSRSNNVSSWSSEATAFFESSTKSAQRLVGFVVPWDSEMVNNIVNYCQGAECSLPNLGPVLSLNLYDVSDDEDVFINGALVKANLAFSSTIIAEEEVVDPDLSSNVNEQVCEVSSSSDPPVVKMTKQNLTDMAKSLKDSEASPPSSANPSSPSSPVSPTLKLLEAWNPMSHDYESTRNANNVHEDNVDVAIMGYEEDRGKICRYYRTKYGCFRGSKCRDKHVEEELTGQLCIYGAQSSMSVCLPETGTWVAVRVTAVYNPGHFWVQLPFGKEALDSQLIKSRSGKETSGEENLKDLDDLMKRMSEFYSKKFRRERSLAPVAEGELVALRYTKDNQWYRGKVCHEKDDKYEVCFVDYGFSDRIKKCDICPMLPHFLHLPFQAVECFLANIKPKGAPLLTDSWSVDSQRRFEALIEDKVLVCQILSTDPDRTMLVNLFDAAEGEERNISEEMIKCGLAEEADFKVTKPLVPALS